MRIALVNPVGRRTQGYHTIGSYIPQLGLQVLARLVPAPHTVEIIDEIFGSQQTAALLTPDRYDLVGITAYTSSAARAYELATHCRAQKIPCIMGGPHASALPDEAGRYFDSVAVGECDEIWPAIIAEAAAGKLQPRYEGHLTKLVNGYGTCAQNLHPVNGKYTVSCIQTSRGCPVGCDYCSVTRFNGPEIRRRPIDEIVAEWNATADNFIFVVDDNFFGVGPKHAAWAKELLRAIAARGKKRLWFSQTTINMGDDKEGLDLAYQAGCRGMLIGFETFNPVDMKGYHKGLNTKLLSRYEELVTGFHKSKVAVFGCFIIGGDSDTEDTVSETALRAVQIGIDIIQITNLTPLPGTTIYDNFMRDGRIFATNYPTDWERYSFVETVYNPVKMTARRLDETIYELRRAAAVEPWVWKRTLRALLRTGSLTTAAFVHGINSGWNRMAKIQAPEDAKSFGFVPTPENPRYEMICRAFAFRNGKLALKPETPPTT